MSHPRRLTQEQERGLLRRLRARDESALAELYDALAPWVLGLAFRILQDEDEAEEVVADTFTQVWTRVDRHDETRGALVPWILSIARHRALHELRRRTRWWRRAERWGEAQIAEHDAGALTYFFHRLLRCPRKYNQDYPDIMQLDGASNGPGLTL